MSNYALNTLTVKKNYSSESLVTLAAKLVTINDLYENFFIQIFLMVIINFPTVVIFSR